MSDKTNSSVEGKLITRQESRNLGRAEYWNPANKGKSLEEVWQKFVKNGVSNVYKSEFISGWYVATMLADDEPSIAPEANYWPWETER